MSVDAVSMQSMHTAWGEAEWQHFCLVGSFNFDETTRDMLRQIFEVLDVDKSGFLSDNDLRVMPAHSKPFSSSTQCNALV